MRRLLDGLVLDLDVPAREDARGRLLPLQFPLHGFMPVRAFLVEARDGARRGGHAHRRARQLLMRTSGEVELELRHDGAVERLRLTDASRLVLIEPRVWASQAYRGTQPALLVFSDCPYDPDDYLDDPL